MNLPTAPHLAFTKPFEKFTRLPVMPDMTLLPTWGNAAFKLAQTGLTIAMTSQQVATLRLSMMATKPGQATTNRESQRMVTEKMEAMHESAARFVRLSTNLVSAWPKLWTDPKAADRILRQTLSATNHAMAPFSQRVSSNAKRLTR